VTPPQESIRTLLTRCWVLNRARRYPELVEQLRAVPEAQLDAEPALGFMLADVLRRLGEGQTALDVLQRIGPVLDRRGNDRLHRRRLNLLGTLHFEQGRTAEAAAVWERQREDATTASDEEFVARANNNLGILFTLAANWEEAVCAYNRAVTSYQRLGYSRGLAQSHHNLAMTYREMGFAVEAGRHFADAVALAAADSPDEVARSEQERALLHLFEGDVELAEASAQRSLDRYRALGDPTGEGEVTRVLALVALALGRLDSARAHLDKATELADQVDAVLLGAELLEARAVLERLCGRDEEAHRAEERAEAVFRRLHAAPWGRQIRERTRQVGAVARDALSRGDGEAPS
jgi:tetratricopeptide (TPR) repeat protein